MSDDIYIDMASAFKCTSYVHVILEGKFTASVICNECTYADDEYQTARVRLHAKAPVVTLRAHGGAEVILDVDEVVVTQRRHGNGAFTSISEAYAFDHDAGTWREVDWRERKKYEEMGLI